MDSLKWKQAARLAQWMLLLLAWGGAAHALHAQRLRAEDSFSANPKEGDWRFDDHLHKAWFFQSGEWKQMPLKNCRSVENCHGHVILKDGFTYTLATESGKILASGAPRLHCEDDFIVLGGPGHLDYLLTSNGDTLTPVVNNCKWMPDTLGGERVYCIPAYSPGLETYSCAQLRNWGMMDPQGRWRIVPQYDHPFHFEKGIATVWYKGRPQTINENGEILEPNRVK